MRPRTARRLLVIDVGNTATSFGTFDSRPSPARIAPAHMWTLRTVDILQRSFRSRLRKSQRVVPADVIVSSVVPEIDPALRKAVVSAFNVTPTFVTGHTPSRVAIKYKKPSEVGADRIVNARAAMALRPGRPAIIVDFGTATTFDCVSAKGEYLGGVIAPGPVIAAQALYERTSKLPMVSLDRPAAVLGRNTLESIQSGLYHGYRGLVKEIVRQLKGILGRRVAVMATGGQAHWILRGVPEIDENIPSLTLIGLYHMWTDLQKPAAID